MPDVTQLVGGCANRLEIGKKKNWSLGGGNVIQKKDPGRDGKHLLWSNHGEAEGIFGERTSSKSLEPGGGGNEKRKFYCSEWVEPGFATKDQKEKILAYN